MKKKTAGIITMHKVMNYGSVLQAYALQQAITNLGYNTEIIDYTYPNNFHLKNQPKKSLSYKIAKFGFGIMRKILFSVLYQGDKKSKINSFSKRYLNLSSKTYDTVESIQLNPPEYDVYITLQDENGLKSIFGKNENGECLVDITDMADYEIKAFVWDDMTPKSKVVGY